jgi:hypothetical protein
MGPAYRNKEANNMSEKRRIRAHKGGRSERLAVRATPDTIHHVRALRGGAESQADVIERLLAAAYTRLKANAKKEKETK